MRPFAYERATDLVHAARLGRDTAPGAVHAPTQFLAGGTTLVDLMKLDVLRPQRVVDIGGLHSQYSGITVGPQGLRLGALAKMSAVAAHPGVLAHYPVVAQSLQLAASAQLRNMATLGGNVLQRTRCNYFRDTSWSACNKREPGSGCAALAGVNRNHAVLGVDSSCIAQYPGDFGIALVALDAQVELNGPQGPRRIPFAALHKPLDGKPQTETTLHPGEIITGFAIPPGAWTARSVYVKVRDRASYEFAIASAAVALQLDGDTVRQVRIGLGGLAYTPWRAHDAEALLTGHPLTESRAEAAADLALRGAVTHEHNRYKPALARQTLVRALLQAQALPQTPAASTGDA